MNDDIAVLNDPRLIAKVNKSGSKKFHVKITADPVVVDFRPLALGQEVANAIAHHLKERVRNISATASAATIRARESARRALQRGEPWATKRYAGGKMGSREPAQSDRLFNDSGRFAESIVAKPDNKDAWRVNVAANRLSPDTLSGGEAALARIWQRLLQLVPEFADMNKLMQESDIVRARVRTAQRMVRVARAGEVLRGVWDLTKQVVETVDDVLAG